MRAGRFYPGVVRTERMVAKMKTALKKIEYELAVFLILAVKLPFEQLRFYAPAYYFSAAAAAIFFGAVLRRAEKEAKTYWMVFAAFLLAGDMMKTLMMPSASSAFVLYGKVFSILCYLLCVFLIRKPRLFFHKPVFGWLIPPLCAAGILASQSFVFFFIPSVLILMVFEKYKSKQTGKDFIWAATFSVSILLALALLSRGWDGRYFSIGFFGFKTAFSVLAKTGILKALTAVLPLLPVFPAMWVRAFRTSADKGLRRLLALCGAAPFAVFILCVFFYYPVSDGWKYYVSAVLFTQFCMLFYFLDSREKTVTDAFALTAGFFKKNPLILLAVLVYLIKASQILYGM